VFSDVSIKAGIKEDGYGLGVVVSDFNGDGWPDIYVANDYISNDLLWQNNGNGTFTNVIAKAVRHQSYNSMGVDAADINNDGLTDLAVLDMSPVTNQRKKMMFSGSSPERFEMERRMGYQAEYSRNMLQLNNGVRGGAPFFSEIGQLAGISQTDWSWSVLMADFDNDGWKDMYVSNGLAKDLTNNDFLFFWQSFYTHDYQFGHSNNTGTLLEKNQVRILQKELDKYGSLRLNNFFFHNVGGDSGTTAAGDPSARSASALHFTDMSADAGIITPAISQGAVYVDLDNDGDLDLVVNNMNQPAFVWKNETRSTAADSGSNFLTISLIGMPDNKTGIGSKVTIYKDHRVQYLEQYPVRGYASSVDNRLHFGLGNARTIDSLMIEWPDGVTQVSRDIKTNQLITVNRQDASHPAAEPPAKPPAGEPPAKPLAGKPLSMLLPGTATSPLFTDISAEAHLPFRHHEINFNDFGYQRLMPRKYSQLGPAVATGDVNGDGLEDVFVGGAAHQSGKIFIQRKDGSFVASDLISGDKFEEDIGAVFFDADGDKDLDLLVTGGSTEYGLNNSYDQPRLYINDGHGHFTLDKDAMPADVHTVATAVAVADLDGDGQPDIFIGGRILPNKYPASPRSYILKNEKGKFNDVTAGVCPSLAKAGMVSAALWTDFNNDHQPDLVIAGEFMPVRFFKNTNGKLEEITESTGLTNMNGLWRSLRAVDLDHDGDMDFVVGNIGLNNKYHVSADRPMMLYAKDFDGNGFTDPIAAYYIPDNEGKYELFPETDRNQLGMQVPVVKKKYLMHADYAKITAGKLLDDLGRDGLMTLRCDNMTSMWIENLGNGKFAAHPLPTEAQFAPVNAILAADFYQDGNIDLLLAGNEYQEAVANGRYDASYGLLLKGNGKGTFTPVAPVRSGWVIDGDVKNIRMIRTAKKEDLIIAGVNDDSVRIFRWNGH